MSEALRFKLIKYNAKSPTTFDEGVKEWGTVLGVLAGVMGGVTVGLEVIKMGYYFAGKTGGHHPWEGGH